MNVDLEPKEVKILLEALESHRYWQLSDPLYRNDGDVVDPGTDDPENFEKLQEVKELEDKLGAAYVEMTPPLPKDASTP